MKGPASKTILPDGTAPGQGEREVGQANTKGFFASLRKRIPEGHDHHVAESTSADVGHLGCHDSGSVGAVLENKAGKPSLSGKFRALVTSMTSRRRMGPGANSAPSPPSLATSIKSGPLQPEPAISPSTASVSVSPSSQAEHASAASVSLLPDARQQPAPTTASTSSPNGSRPTFAAFLENVALAESTRGQTESSFPQHAEANITDDAPNPPLPHNSSVPITYASSWERTPKLNAYAARRIPGPAFVDDTSLQPKQPACPPLATPQDAAVGHPSVDAHPVPPTSASSPTYTPSHVAIGIPCLGRRQ